MLERILARREAQSRARHLARCLILSALGAALTAVGARIAIPLWPVPVTLQVFFVLLCGAALGRKWGAAAQAQYLAAGLCGLPVFAGGRAGPAALLGPTGGYLVGFVAAAYVTGWLTEALGSRGDAPSQSARFSFTGTGDVIQSAAASVSETRREESRPRRRSSGVARGAWPYAATLAGAGAIWLCGWAWLAVWAVAGGEAAPLRAAFAWGVAPFIALDAVKAVAAAGAAQMLNRGTEGTER